MAHASVAEWLKGYLEEARKANLVLAALAACGALALLFLTFWLMYLFVYLSLGAFVELSRTMLCLCSVVALVGMFYANARLDRAYLAELSVSTGTNSDTVVNLGSAGSNINPLAPDTAHSLLKTVLNLLFCGPRLTLYARESFQQCRRFQRCDVQACAEVLKVLYGLPRGDLERIQRALPDVRCAEVLPQVLEIPGVMRVSGDPPALALTQDLRDEIAKLPSAEELTRNHY